MTLINYPVHVIFRLYEKVKYPWQFFFKCERFLELKRKSSAFKTVKLGAAMQKTVVIQTKCYYK